MARSLPVLRENASPSPETAGIARYACNCCEPPWTFGRRAELNRHVAKKRKLYRCEEHGTDFGTQNDLQRHYHDVHGTDLEGNPIRHFPCPWAGCPRSSRGFPRESGLRAHLEKMHAGKSPESPEPRRTSHRPQPTVQASPRNHVGEPIGREPIIREPLGRDTLSRDLSTKRRKVQPSMSAYDSPLLHERWRQFVHQSFEPQDVTEILSSEDEDDEAAQALVREVKELHVDIRQLEEILERKRTIASGLMDVINKRKLSRSWTPVGIRQSG